MKIGRLSDHTLNLEQNLSANHIEHATWFNQHRLLTAARTYHNIAN
jgi:hypothetical protein